MGALEVFDPLADLRAAGLSVTLDAGKLIVRPASKLTDALRQSLRDRRAIILAGLSAEHAERERIHAELAPLVRACGDRYGFTEAEHAESLRGALDNPNSTPERWRALLAIAPPTIRPPSAPTVRPVPDASPALDTRPACARCRHRKTKFNPAGYCGQRQDLPPVYGDNHQLRHLPDDGGASCAKFEA